MDPYNPGGYGPPGQQGPFGYPSGADPRYPQGPAPQAPPPKAEGMGTGAKVGIGIAIGCVATILILLIVMLMMGACTCQACSSCCSQMSDLAEKSRQMEEREAAKIHPVGETVQVESLAITVTDAQRQEATLVITMQIENTSLIEEELDPKQFILEDSGANRYAVDREKAQLTMDAVHASTQLEPESTVTVRGVFTVPQEATGLVLEFKTADVSPSRRRFALGL